MKNIKVAIRNVSVPLAAALLLNLFDASAASAADLKVAPDLFQQPAPAPLTDWSFKAVDGPSSYAGEFGLRFWFGRGSTTKSLYDTNGSTLVSRLNYGDLSIFGGEAFTRLDFNNGWFLKAYGGGAGLFEGKLKDEDFPPALSPFSATSSGTNNGSIVYGSIDGGFKIFRGPDFYIGTFVGYHFMRETLNAYGCGQVATNPNVCGFGCRIR